jgi:Glycosyltransferases, probably involved in cell wall biogenesis
MITIIIPLYNSACSLLPLIASLYPLETACEIVLINDGSTDNTAELCRKLAEEHDEIRFISKPHTGVSDTRNAGIKAAKGKYILFLDADDQIEKGSVRALEVFFDHCDENVDLVTYPLETRYRGKVMEPHFRYQTLNHSDVYDLNVYPYIGQTTMNIAVRNKFAENVLFDVSMTFSEDQKYCCDVVRNSLKIGFCNDAKYIYNRSENSSSGMLNGACYVFEQAMKMFEDLFRGYEIVPAAFQGLYINDLAWKLRAGILYPYHYDDKSFEFAMCRVKALLLKVDSGIILKHPQIDHFHKFYWLSLKPEAGVTSFFTERNYGLKLADEIIFQSDRMEIVVIRLRLDNGMFVFRGFIKSPVFHFCEQPELLAVVNGEQIRQELFLSAHSYYLCHTQTNRFYGFCMEVPADKLHKFSFAVKVRGILYSCSYYFMPKSPFSHELRRYDSVIGNRCIHFDIDSGEFVFLPDEDPAAIWFRNGRILPRHCSELRKKAVLLKKEKKIHLYYDCRGVEKDNGYYKFLEDRGRKDGITRKYICSLDNKKLREIFSKEQLTDVIRFDSKQHKVYFLAAERIHTAYIEDINLFPFPADELDMYSDFFGFEVVYLQHGILHGSLPWKYTPEVIPADKVCISTDYEQKLFTEKYHFRKQDVLIEPMRRLCILDKKAVPERKILFAPSWRQYLIGPDIEGIWQPLDKVFRNSDYFKNISAFLNSPQLEKFLEERDYVIEFKLHPIFSVYKALFHIYNNHVKMIDQVDKIEKYEIFITDFSSYAFDFFYLDRKVFSFMPDEMQFRCGMNSYREIEPESKKMFIPLKGCEDMDKIFEPGTVDHNFSFLGILHK